MLSSLGVIPTPPHPRLPLPPPRGSPLRFSVYGFGCRVWGYWGLGFGFSGSGLGFKGFGSRLLGLCAGVYMV